MAEPEAEPIEQVAAPELVTVDFGDSQLHVRDAAKREIDMRVVPWGVVADGRKGLETFQRGAFVGTNPKHVVIRLNHEDPPAGVGTSLEERDDGAYMTFRVSATQRGDEILTLAADGVTRGTSPGYFEVPGGIDIETRNGRRTRVVRRADLREVSTCWLPTWEQSAVLAVRSQEGDGPMAEPKDPAVVVAAPVAPEPAAQPAPPAAPDITPLITQMSGAFDKVLDRMEKLEERSRQNVVIPAAPGLNQRAKRGDWMATVIRMLSGERVADLQVRALDDLITSDNVGVVPPAYLAEMIGVIDPSRPFLQSTRKLDLPAAGMSLIVPKIVTRPTAAVQARYGSTPAEKSDVDSTATSITTATYDAVTIAGGGDISLQLLKRSSPSFLSLYLELLFEAYALNAESEALGSLLDTVGDLGGVNDGSTLDPEDLILTNAWQAGATVRKRIDTMWLSSAAVGAFIDAKADTTNQPLYSNIQAGFTAGTGAGGTISGLRPIWVPQLDAEAYDILVGPSSGFGWTEDGTYTLQVDVPAKAGRDVAVAGILWFAPMYPTAFTAYILPTT